MNRSGERSQRRDASADRFVSDDDDDKKLIFVKYKNEVLNAVTNLLFVTATNF